MKTLTINDIRALEPCYDPIKHLPEDWSGTIQELLCYEHIPAKDRLWVAMKTKLLSDHVLKEFGAGCARLVEHLANDDRVINCNNVTERFLDGNATEQERRNAATYSAASAAAHAYAATYATSAASAASAASADPSRIEMEEQQCQLLLYVIEMIGE